MKAEKNALKFAFRKAVAADAPEITALYKENFSSFTETKGAEKMVAQAIKDDVGSEVITATDAAGNVAGFLIMSVYNSFEPGNALNVDAVAVDEKYRGQGLGRALMEHAEEIATKFRYATMTLQVHEDNEAARKLYESLGYDVAGKWKKYYKDGGTSIGMEKSMTLAPLPPSPKLTKGAGLREGTFGGTGP